MKRSMSDWVRLGAITAGVLASLACGCGKSGGGGSGTPIVVQSNEAEFNGDYDTSNAIAEDWGPAGQEGVYFVIATRKCPGLTCENRHGWQKVCPAEGIRFELGLGSSLDKVKTQVGKMKGNIQFRPNQGKFAKSYHNAGKVDVQVTKLTKDEISVTLDGAKTSSGTSAKGTVTAKICSK